MSTQVKVGTRDLKGKKFIAKGASDAEMVVELCFAYIWPRPGAVLAPTTAIQHRGVTDTLSPPLHCFTVAGGFSYVFLVKDTTTKEYFALKRMTCTNQVWLAQWY